MSTNEREMEREMENGGRPSGGSDTGKLNFSLVPKAITFKEWGLKQNEDSFSSRTLLIQNTSDSEVSIVMQGPQSDRFTMKSHTSAYPLMFLLPPRETARYTITFIPPGTGEEDYLWDNFNGHISVHSRLGSDRVEVQAFRKDMGTDYIADDAFAPVRGVCPPPPLSKLFSFVETHNAATSPTSTSNSKGQEQPPPVPALPSPALASPAAATSPRESPREKKVPSASSAVNVSFSDAKAVIRMMRMRNNVNKLVRPSSSASHHGSVLSDAEWARAIADVENTPVAVAGTGSSSNGASGRGVRPPSSSSFSSAMSPTPASLTPRERDEVVEFNQLVVDAKKQVKAQKKQEDYHTKLLMKSLNNSVSAVSMTSKAQYKGGGHGRGHGGGGNDPDDGDESPFSDSDDEGVSPPPPQTPTSVSKGKGARAKSIDFSDSDDDVNQPFQGSSYNDDDDGLGLSDSDDEGSSKWIQAEYNRRLQEHKCAEEPTTFSPQDPKRIAVQSKPVSSPRSTRSNGATASRTSKNSESEKSTFQTSFKPGQRIKVVPRAMKSKQRNNHGQKNDSKNIGGGWNGSKK